MSPREDQKVPELLAGLTEGNSLLKPVRKTRGNDYFFRYEDNNRVFKEFEKSV